jgi:1,4-dihydroxy-2-naphthoate octaprenyltransferase
VEVVAAGALCMAVGFLYNAGPLPLSSTPLGELFAGGFLGSALFLITYYVGSGVLSLHGFLISLPFTLYIASILTVNNSCDLEGDRSAGRKTIVVLCGPLCGRLIIYSAGAGAYALLIAYAAAGLFPETLYYTAPPALLLAVREYVRMERRGYSHATKGANMNAIVRLFALFGMAVMAALLLALV